MVVVVVVVGMRMAVEVSHGWRFWSVKLAPTAEIREYMNRQGWAGLGAAYDAMEALQAETDLTSPIITRRAFEDAMEAECRLLRCQDPPGPDCICGIYAVRRLPDLTAWVLSRMAPVIAYVKLGSPVFDSHLAGEPPGTVRAARAQVVEPIFVRPNYAERLRAQTACRIEPVEAWPAGIAAIAQGYGMNV